MDAGQDDERRRQDRASEKAKPHPEQGFRACLGILRLEKSYGAQRLEAACHRGNDIGATSYGSVDRLVHNAHRLTLNGDSMRKAAARTVRT